MNDADFDTLIEIMRCGGHATVAGCLRSALFNYGIHFTRQGLMDIPAGAFSLDLMRR